MSEELRTFLRLKQVKAMIGMSRSWIYDAVQHGKFPAPISLGVRAVAWDAGDVANWQKSRIQKSLRNALKGGL